MFDFLFLISSILLLTIDFFYLNLVKDYFVNQIKTVQGSQIQINYLGTAICYLFLIIGLNYFIIKPRKSVNDAFLLGIVVYGVFETTNYALFKNWSIFTVIMDTLWGGILFGSVTYLTYIIKNLF